jgi:transcriptional regulator with XRE-family HTH domain
MARTATPTRITADEAAFNALVPTENRASYDARVAALLARNRTLELIETQRDECRMSKKELADRAGLDASAVRKLLTAQTANPTSENVFRLMGALGIHVEAVTPSGKRVSLV